MALMMQGLWRHLQWTFLDDDSDDDNINNINERFVPNESSSSSKNDSTTTTFLDEHLHASSSLLFGNNNVNNNSRARGGGGGQGRRNSVASILPPLLEASFLEDDDYDDDYEDDEWTDDDDDDSRASHAATPSLILVPFVTSTPHPPTRAMLTVQRFVARHNQRDPTYLDLFQPHKAQIRMGRQAALPLDVASYHDQQCQLLQAFPDWNLEIECLRQVEWSSQEAELCKSAGSCVVEALVTSTGTHTGSAFATIPRSYVYVRLDPQLWRFTIDTSTNSIVHLDIQSIDNTKQVGPAGLCQKIQTSLQRFQKREQQKQLATTTTTTAAASSST